MFCNSCGAPLKDGQRFCPSCGASAAPASPAPVPAQPTVKKFPVVLLIVGGVMVCLLLAAIIFVLLRDRGVIGKQLPEYSFTVAEPSSGQLSALDTDAAPAVPDGPATVKPDRPSATNLYYRYFDGQDTYFCAASRSRYLDDQDLRYRNQDELNLIRNELYARYGYIFKTSDLQEFFDCKSWYSPTIPNGTFSDSRFTDVELANLKLILLYEKLLAGIGINAGNPYFEVYTSQARYSGELFPDSSSQKLETWELAGLSAEALVIAKNEIYARNGYGYENEDLLAYFAQWSWYKPSIAPGRKSAVPLNSTETANIRLIEEQEALLDSLDDIPNVSKLDHSLTYDYETPFFYMSLPAYWQKYCVMEDGYGINGYWYTFYEKYSYEQSGGRLFTVNVVTDPSCMEDYPSYEQFCTLTDADGNTYYVILTYPTDVQCLYPAAQSLYSAMYGEIAEILTTLYPSNNYVRR